MKLGAPPAWMFRGAILLNNSPSIHNLESPLDLTIPPLLRIHALYGKFLTSKGSINGHTGLIPLNDSNPTFQTRNR